MKILVDTSIWSLALRRKTPENNPAIDHLRELITEFRVQMIGPIRQEILSGISSVQLFTKLRQYLHAFPDLVLDADDYELAADFSNINRRKGIQGSNTDFLICAISVNHKLPILTVDKDFNHFAKTIPIHLYILPNSH